MVYLDNAATTNVNNEVLKAALPYLTEYYGNPSSTHQMGTVAKNAITEARMKCAKAINAEPEQIIFTSGATESNNLVAKQGEMLVSPFEHPSGRAMWVFHNLVAALDKMGRRGCRDVIVSQMYVNNEVGSVFDIKKCAEIAHKAGYKFHTDCTQAFSHVPIDVKELDCDYLSLSGHKFHAPKGVGLLYVKEPLKLRNINRGGGQENGNRSGTENVFGIVALGKAMELYQYKESMDDHFYALKYMVVDQLKSRSPVDYRINTIDGLPTVLNILNISFKGINAEGLVALLDMDGFMVSQGSACHSGSIEPSKVLQEIGVPDDYIHGTIRISFALNNTLTEVHQFTECLIKYLDTLSKVNTKEKLI